MALNKDEFLLKEPAPIEYGPWTSPHALDGTADPAASFSATGNVGYVRQGTFVVGLNDEFVEYRAGTPYKIVRKDLIGRQLTWQFTANQFNPTLLDFMYNVDETNGSAYDLMWIGNDAPVKTRQGWHVAGELVDGSAISFSIWAGEVTTEDKSLNFPGTDYVDIPVMVQAFEGDTFIANPNDEHNYGMIWRPATS